MYKNNEVKGPNFKIEVSKKGLPCLWESGGSFTNTGESQIICKNDGQPKKAIYVRKSGSLACSEHALIPVEIGDLIISVSHQRRDFRINILRISKIDNETCETVNIRGFDRGEWDDFSYEIVKKIQSAIDAAKAKATDYHCRTPYFIKE